MISLDKTANSLYTAKMTYIQKIKFGGTLLLISVAIEVIATCMLTVFSEFAAITALTALFGMLVGWMFLIDGLVDRRISKRV